MLNFVKKCSWLYIATLFAEKESLICYFHVKIDAFQSKLDIFQSELLAFETKLHTLQINADIF